jgi:fructokinase
VTESAIACGALVVGEALVDVVHGTDGSVTSHPGGSPANVALGLGRLGRDVSLLCWLGQDDNGRMVADHLEASGVILAEGSWDAERTSVATARLDASGAATYDFDLRWELPPGARAQGSPVVVHTGSIAAVLDPGADAVLALVTAARASSTITYDPNARPSLMGEPVAARDRVERMIALADVVKVSDEDIEWLTGDTPEAVAPAWIELGPQLVVVTRGGDGATAWTSDGRRIDVTAPRVTVVDTVGAGDSFMGGLIDGLWGAGLIGASQRHTLGTVSTDILEGILGRCARIAAITVSRAGANPPSLAELEEFGA